MAVVYVEYRLPGNFKWLWDGTALPSMTQAKPGTELWKGSPGQDIQSRTRIEFRGVVVPSCRHCGCTDEFACEGGCYWVEEDLCSRCAIELSTALVLAADRWAKAS